MSGSGMRSEPSATGACGFTLIELVVASALIAVLAATAMPLYEVSVKREREIELRHALREIRRAIDQFHESYVASGGATAARTKA